MDKTRWLRRVASLSLPLLASLGCGASALDSGDGVSAMTAALGPTSETLLPSATRPRLTGLSPHTASNRGGAPLLLTGSNFAAGARVKIAGGLANSSVLSSTTIAVTLPAQPGRCGQVPVRVPLATPT